MKSHTYLVLLLLKHTFLVISLLKIMFNIIKIIKRKKKKTFILNDQRLHNFGCLLASVHRIFSGSKLKAAAVYTFYVLVKKLYFFIKKHKKKL